MKGSSLYLGLAVLMTSPAMADVRNLQMESPVQIEDATVIAPGETDTEILARYERTADDTDLLRLVPNLQYGLAEGIQAEIQIPVNAGNADRRNSGDIEAKATTVLITEQVWTPDVALVAEVIAPTGVDSAGLDTELKIIFSKTVGPSQDSPRVHLNAAWRHNDRAREDEREHRAFVAAGLSQAFTEKFALVFDLVREEARENDKTDAYTELGARYGITKSAVLSAGVGTGFGSDAPRVLSTLGFEQSF